MISERDEVGNLGAKENTSSQPMNLAYISGGAMFLRIALFTALSLWGLAPPRRGLDNAPPPEFPSSRAMSHVRAIAQKPHPIGSVVINCHDHSQLQLTLTQSCPTCHAMTVRAS